MPKKTERKPHKEAKSEKRSPLRSVLLTLTLVPLVIGIILIGAWALDFEIFDDPQANVILGIMFFLLSFAASNALIKKWRLAAGWGLLMVADLAVLAWLQLWAQVVAIGVGLAGLAFLGVEFYQQYRQNQEQSGAK